MDNVSIPRCVQLDINVVWGWMTISVDFFYYTKEGVFVFRIIAASFLGTCLNMLAVAPALPRHEFNVVECCWICPTISNNKYCAFAQVNYVISMQQIGRWHWFTKHVIDVLSYEVMQKSTFMIARGQGHSVAVLKHVAANPGFKSWWSVSQVSATSS